MAELTLPPYHGSAEDLLHWLQDYLKRFPPQYAGGPTYESFYRTLAGVGGAQREPEPSPRVTAGRFDGGRTLFLTGIALKQVAANLPEGHALASAADQAIADWEDEYCGTPPRPLPTLGLAALLAEFASTLQAGDLQTAIQEEAGRLARKAFAPALAAQPAAVKAA